MQFMYLSTEQHTLLNFEISLYHYRIPITQSHQTPADFAALTVLGPFHLLDNPGQVSSEAPPVSLWPACVPNGWGLGLPHG